MRVNIRSCSFGSGEIMQIGAVFAQIDMDPSGLRDYAQAVQGLGYEHVLIADHVLGTEGEGRGWPAHLTMHEPLVMCGYFAAAAPGLRLATSVLVLPQRQTALVAKQAAEVDVLSSGNLRFGVGIGFSSAEYDGLGMNFHNRARRFEEQIQLLRRLWTEPVLTFDGQYEHISAAGINPLPTQRPIPIWIGASTESAIRRAAEIADGFFPFIPLEGGWHATIDKLQMWLSEAGRDPTRFGIDARIRTDSGTPDDWHAQAQEWRSLGATHVSVSTRGAGRSGPDAHVECLRIAIEAVRP
jgi:probable F420-dependent oxidoreductase